MNETLQRFMLRSPLYSFVDTSVAARSSDEIADVSDDVTTSDKLNALIQEEGMTFQINTKLNCPAGLKTCPHTLLGANLLEDARRNRLAVLNGGKYGHHEIHTISLVEGAEGAIATDGQARTQNFHDSNSHIEKNSARACATISGNTLGTAMQSSNHPFVATCTNSDSVANPCHRGHLVDTAHSFLQTAQFSTHREVHDFAALTREHIHFLSGTYSFSDMGRESEDAETTCSSLSAMDNIVRGSSDEVPQVSKVTLKFDHQCFDIHEQIINQHVVEEK